MRYTVNSEDLAIGQRLAHSGCPIKHAITRQTGIEDVSVFPAKICIAGELYDTPPAVAAFIDWHDSGLPGYPFEFEL